MSQKSTLKETTFLMIIVKRDEIYQNIDNIQNASTKSCQDVTRLLNYTTITTDKAVEYNMFLIQWKKIEQKRQDIFKSPEQQTFGLQFLYFPDRNKATKIRKNVAQYRKSSKDFSIIG